MNIHRFELGTKPIMVRSTPLTEARGKVFYREDEEAKEGYYSIGYSLSSCLIWGSLVGCLQLVVLKFHFLGFECIDSGLDFDFLM